jgi:hypothetical protein
MIRRTILTFVGAVSVLASTATAAPTVTADIHEVSPL